MTTEELRIRTPKRRPAARPSPSGEARAPESVCWTDPNGSWRYVPSRSAAMRALEQRSLRVAPSGESVLILGETGVGKDLLARLIHQNSSRRNRAFVHLNCASLPEGLLEAELFGHVRGAYTGAGDSQPGQFEVASGGTIFLDEIGELPPRLQAKLLHVLQERKIYRLGGRQVLSIDVRVLAATNRDLRMDIRSGAFRRDLFYRLGVVTLQVPPLRHRPEDLEDLTRHFFRRYATLYNREELSDPGGAFLEALRRSSWPGNIRELENAIKRVILLGGPEHLDGEMAELLAAEDELSTTASDETLVPQAAPRSLREVTQMATRRAERRAILEALKRAGWNRKRAARELRMSYRSLLYKIKDYTLRPEPVVEPTSHSSA